MLVDRLEAVINSGWRAPMTGKVAVDEQEAMDVLDLMRTTIPDEIKQARRLNQERDKILAQAQTEANRIVAQAQERAERMVQEDNLRLMAEDRAHDLVDQARREAEDVRRSADEWAMQRLDMLDRELQRIEHSVRQAMDALSRSPQPVAVSEDEQ
ncbi:MAG TPA: ATPase [Chloroflexota bacterium]|nr:ATPase [Chloroflexota bacterium]